MVDRGVEFYMLKDYDLTLADEFSSRYIISTIVEKVLVPAECPVCHVKGMTYVDSKNPQSKLHYCIKHNPRILGADAS